MLSLIRTGVVYSGQGIFSGILFACPAWAVLDGHPSTLASLLPCQLLCPWSNVGFPAKRAACTIMQELWISSHIFWSFALSSIHRDVPLPIAHGVELGRAHLNRTSCGNHCQLLEQLCSSCSIPLPSGPRGYFALLTPKWPWATTSLHREEPAEGSDVLRLGNLQT